MTSTILLLSYLFILNIILAVTFKSEFGSRVNRYRYLLLIPPFALLAWTVIFFTFCSLRMKRPWVLLFCNTPISFQVNSSRM
jgi:hypothetical protein